ncbi:MAG: hypothetical protein DHS80DRAFT_30507 [Piptocephalis tieghemiana]|nr:MAG: hypothetical protein DHS80DRAFT_30507 [Piptocephalis tieghemiana]
MRLGWRPSPALTCRPERHLTLPYSNQPGLGTAVISSSRSYPEGISRGKMPQAPRIPELWQTRPLRSYCAAAALRPQGKARVSIGIDESERIYPSRTDDPGHRDMTIRPPKGFSSSSSSSSSFKTSKVRGAKLSILSVHKILRHLSSASPSSLDPVIATQCLASLKHHLQQGHVRSGKATSISLRIIILLPALGLSTPAPEAIKAWKMAMHVPLHHGSDTQALLAWRHAFSSKSLYPLLYLPDPLGFSTLELHQWLNRLLTRPLSSLPLSTRSHPSSSPSLLRCIRTLLPSLPSSVDPLVSISPVCRFVDRVNVVNGSLFGVLADDMMKHSMSPHAAKKLLSHAARHHPSYTPPPMVLRHLRILERSRSGSPGSPLSSATPEATSAPQTPLPWDLPSLHQEVSLAVRIRQPRLLHQVEAYARRHGLIRKGHLLKSWIIGWSRLGDTGRGLERWDEWSRTLEAKRGGASERDRLLAEVCLGWGEDWRGALHEVYPRIAQPDHQRDWTGWTETRMALVLMYLRSLRRDEEWLSGIPPRASPPIPRDLLHLFLPSSLPLPLSKEITTLNALWTLAHPSPSSSSIISMAAKAKYLRGIVEWAGPLGLAWSWEQVGPGWVRQARTVHQRRWWWIQWARYAQGLAEDEKTDSFLIRSTILTTLRSEVPSEDWPILHLYSLFPFSSSSMSDTSSMEGRLSLTDDMEGIREVMGIRHGKKDGLGRRVFNALRLLGQLTSWTRSVSDEGELPAEEEVTRMLGRKLNPDEILDLYAHLLHLTANQARKRHGLILGVMQRTYRQLRGNSALFPFPWSNNIFLASGLARLHAHLGDARAVRTLLDGHDQADRVSEALLLLAHARAGDVAWLEGRMSGKTSVNGHPTLLQDPWAWSALLLAYREKPQPGLIQAWYRMEDSLGIRRIREVGSGLLVRLALQAATKEDFPLLWDRIRFLGLTSAGGAFEVWKTRR